MTWTATIKSAQRTARGTSVALSIEFSDGDRRYTIPYEFSNMADVPRQCRNQIELLQGVDDYLAAEHTGEVVNYVLPTPEPQPKPTDEQKAQIAYQQKRTELLNAKQDLELGLIEQATFDALKADVISAKPVPVVAMKEGL